MLNAVLQTERLSLRPLVPADARHLQQYVVRNRDWLAPWEPTHPASYFTAEGQRNILLQCEDERRADTGILFGIFERNGDPTEVLGRISISGIMRGIWQNGFLGYSIACSRAGRGYMTETLRRVVHYGFMDLGLHRLQASIIPRNQASLRVAQKCDFRHEGRALRYLKISDVWEDHDMYALTYEEFTQGACR
ncbi:MAG: GNAT family N-acetyltransferase [Candidatus Lambdaproteobacteria bacterium]|nr:GNAT family N-acetyltransferase [Candidatus Lambdaproteobacteria bacterium]